MAGVRVSVPSQRCSDAPRGRHIQDLHPTEPVHAVEHRDALDALFLVSSPNTEPALIQVLLDAKMGASSGH
jgi:hypothetical protein